MNDWLERLWELDACIVGSEDLRTEETEKHKKQAVWSETAAAEALRQAKQENELLWQQFHLEQQGLWRDISDCDSALQFLRAADRSIADQEKYEKTLSAHRAELAAERAKLHFSAADAIKKQEVFAALADVVNQHAVTNQKHTYRQACVRFSAWTEYAREVLQKERTRLTDEMQKRLAAKEAEVAEKKKAFSAQLTEMWEKTFSGGQSEPQEQQDTAAGQNAPQTAAAVRISDFRHLYDPEEVRAEYAAVMNSVMAPANYQRPEVLPEQVVFGTLVYDMQAAGFKPETITFLHRNYPYLCDETVLRMPLVLSLDAAMNCRFRYPEGSDAETVSRHAIQLLFEMLMALSPEHMQMLRLTDAHNYLAKLAVFQNLIDPKRKETEERVFTNVRRGKQEIQLGLTAVMRYLEHILQDVLAGFYDSLFAFHRDNPEKAEAYTVVAALLDPAALDQETLAQMLEIAEAGPGCGIFTWLFDTSMKPQKGESENQALMQLYERMTHSFVYDPASGRYRYETQDSDYPLYWEPLPFPNAVSQRMGEKEYAKTLLNTQKNLLEMMRGAD